MILCCLVFLIHFCDLRMAHSGSGMYTVFSESMPYSLVDIDIALWVVTPCFVVNIYTAFWNLTQCSICALPSVLQAEACFSLQHGYHSNPTTPKHQHTSNQEHTTNVVIQQSSSQVPDDGYINVRNMLSA